PPSRTLHGLGRRHSVRTAGAQVVVLDPPAEAVPLGPFGPGDGVPDRLGRRLDVHPVDRRGDLRLRHGRHPASSSSSVLSSASADTRRSRYLSIHRSWISRIGTGFRKWSFSRPDRRVTMSPASCRARTWVISR